MVKIRGKDRRGVLKEINLRPGGDPKERKDLSCEHKGKFNSNN